MKLSANLLFLALLSFSFMCAKCTGNGDGYNDGTEISEPVDPPKPEPEPEPELPSLGIEAGEVTALLGRVADWQMANFTYMESGSPGALHDYGIDAWTNATLYMGMLEWAKVAPSPDIYFDWLNGIGNKSGWKIAANFTDSRYSLYHADELCIGQFHLGMYEKYRKPEMLKNVRNRVDWIINNPPNPDMGASVKQSWTWCDALFMAPPVYAELGNITGDGKYVRFMDMLFKRTCAHLYSENEGLFYRDDTYFGKKESNGQNVYWGRGNGWVAAGLAGVLELLPADSEYRVYYEDMFRKFIPRLVSLQGNDGFWHASLLDPGSYPAPETSVTALITYAVAFGIDKGLLDATTYIPAVSKGWKAIETIIDESGKVGWVQPIGASPQSVTKESTAVYGAGAVLMAGAEIDRLIDKLDEKHN